MMELTSGMYVAILNGLEYEINELKKILENSEHRDLKDEVQIQLQDAQSALVWIKKYRNSN